VADLADLATDEIELQQRLIWAARQTQGQEGPGDGTCTDCGDPIRIERLRVHPKASRCIDCQMDHERWESHTNHNL